MNLQTPVRAMAAAAAVVAIVLPISAQTQTDASATQIYQQERADCLAGRTSQSKADCLYEARSALRDRRSGGLEPGESPALASPAYDSGGSSTLPPRADRH